MPLLRHSPAASAVTFGPRLVDDPDDAERHPHLAQLEPVGQRRAAHDLADRVGQGRDVAQPVGHRRDAALVEREPVDQALGGAGVAGGLHVLGVGGQHLRRPRLEGVGHGVQRGVLRPPGQGREGRRGGAGASGSVEDLAHAPSVDVVSRAALDQGRLDAADGDLERGRRPG